MKTSQPNMEDNALHSFFIEQLQDIYWAEKYLVKNLKKMAKEATSDELKAAFENHLKETEIQVTRLEEVFDSVGEKAKAKRCPAMEGLVNEAHELIENTEKGTMVRDAALIAAAQKIEHYEVASYGTLKTFAGVMSYTKAQKLLEQTLEEEKNADVSLTKIAEGFVNESALEEAV
jgi:ferritin-like metal-binding protein YciE